MIYMLFLINIYLFMIFIKLDKIKDILEDIRAHIECNSENEE